MRRAAILTATLLVALAAVAAPHAAEIQPLGEQVLLQADTVTYDQDNRIVVASGNVEISSGERVLVADEVVYDERADKVAARGNVAVLEPSGNVIFADGIELTRDLRAGFIDGFRALLADQTKIAAVSGERRDGNITEMSRGVFSACELCPTDRTRAPLWQFKAVRVIHDEQKQRIEYQDVILEFFGIPVAYTPYFSHPDPRVTRKSGFLAPEYGSSSALGQTLQIPYFFNLAPHRDFTLAPIFTTKEGVVAFGEYRERTAAGRFDVKASITQVDERNPRNVKTGDREIRGHILSQGRFDPNPTWRWGFDVNRSTDDTYLRRYDFGNFDSLTTRLYVDGFRRRNSMSANAYAFQGLRVDDDPSRTAVIPTLFDYNLISEPGRYGDTFLFDANLLLLTRDEGPASNRLSLNGGWRLPYIGRDGSVYTMTASLRGDGYIVDDVPTSSNARQAVADGGTGRILPQLALEWRYPMIRDDGSVRQTIEPIVLGVVSPYGGNPNDIPNEDSLAFQFDATNLLTASRFPGLDRVESGPRVNYGVRVGVYSDAGGYGTLLIGQSLRTQEDDTFADKTGLEDRRSDYVSHLYFVPSEFIDFTNRLRLDRDTFSIRRNEIVLSAGPRAIRVDASYVALSRELTTDELVGRQEVGVQTRLQITPFWSLAARTRQDISDDRETLSYAAALEYMDECFDFILTAARSFFRDRDIEPSSSIKVRIRLKHIG